MQQQHCPALMRRHDAVKQGLHTSRRASWMLRGASTRPLPSYDNTLVCAVRQTGVTCLMHQWLWKCHFEPHGHRQVAKLSTTLW